MNWKTIIEQCEARGVSQAEIARRAGISHSAVSRLRSGSRSDPRWSIGNAVLTVHRYALRRPLVGTQ